MNDAGFYPILAGGLSAVVVFCGGLSLLERRRNRLRRAFLRSRLEGATADQNHIS
jgi:hypothetical protein